MGNYTYTQNAGNLKKFFKHIQTGGIPDKVTQKYLIGVGFKSTNDRRIISVLKSINFLNDAGAPTEYWKQYRDKSKSKSIIASVVKETYSDLFSTYPDANNRDEEALRNFFGANTELGSKAIGLLVSTFNALCELGDFGSESIITETTDVPTNSPQTLETKKFVTKHGVAVNINIQLTLPETDKAEVYDNFFASFKKYIINDE